MTDPKINVSTGFGGGVSVSLRADSGAELEALIAAATATSPTLARLLQQGGVLAATEQGAVANVQAAFPAAQPVSTVGQPLPQPGVPAQPVASPPPPTLVNPGPCDHGLPRVYVDKPARGTAWRRWECGKPWTRGDDAGNKARCKPINVD